MIIDSLERAALYKLGSAGQDIMTALRALVASHPSPGQYPLGNHCQANVFGYETKLEPASTTPYESHRAMIDVQVLLEGEEFLDICPSPQLTPLTPKNDYDPIKDVEFYHEIPSAQVRVRMQPGMFALLWPSDIHRSGVASSAHTSPIKKVVAKIPVQVLTSLL